MSTNKIRLAAKKDLNFIFNNVAAFYKENPKELMLVSKKQLKKAINALFDNKDNSYFIILLENKEVGFIQAMKTRKDLAEIILIYLKPKYRRMGLGKDALKKVLIKMRNNGAKIIRTEVNVSNTISQKFFENLKFKKHSIMYNLDNLNKIITKK